MADIPQVLPKHKISDSLNLVKSLEMLQERRMALQLAQAIHSLELRFETYPYYWLFQVPKKLTIR